MERTEIVFLICMLTFLVGCQSKKEGLLEGELMSAAADLDLSREESVEKFRKVVNKEPEKIGENSIFDQIAFFEACTRGNPAKVKRFIEGGIDVNAKDTCLGKTALQRACEGGNIENVKILLDAGANIEGKADSRKYGTVGFHWRPLYIACIWEHEDIALLLINRGASIEPTEKDGSPLDCARKRGLTRVVEAILRKTKTR